MPPLSQPAHSAAAPKAATARSPDIGSGDASRTRRGTGRTSRGRDARRRLVAAARQVFERDGFVHARIADVCEEAGLSQPSFYTYFHSKEEVFNEVVDAVDFSMLTMPRPGDVDDPISRLRAANRHYLEFYRDNAGILAVIDQVATFDDAVRADRFERHMRFAGAIERRIRSYQEEGIADPQVDAAFAARALGNMVTTTATQMFIRRRRGDLEHAVDQLTLLWANAIGLASHLEFDVTHETEGR